MKPLAAAVVAFLACVLSASAQNAAEPLLPGNGMHGIHGLTFDDQGHLYVGSVVGQTIYKVDPVSGAIDAWEGPPLGMADDLEFGPGGELAWTSFILGKVHARSPGGAIRELASGLPGINSIAWNAQGRLFATQVFLGDALYEIDPEGEKPPRKIAENMGGLNGFDFGPDGKLYGPLWFKGQVARVDVETGKIEVVAEGFGIPAAANFNSLGELYVLDTQRGEVVRVDTNTGEKTVVAKTPTALDNLAFDNMDRLYVTVMAENAVFRVDIDSGALQPIIGAPLALPADLASHDGMLFAADMFSVKEIDLKAKTVRSVVRLAEDALEYPNGIDVTDHYIHTASWFNNAVQTIDRESGEILHTYHEVPTAYDVLEDADGSLLVLQFITGSLVRLRGEKPEERDTVATGLANPVALAHAGPGQVYVTLHQAGQVVRVDLATGETTVVAEGLAEPEGLAVRLGGNLIVAETGKRRVVNIDPATGAVTALADDLLMGFPLSVGMPPQGITSGVAVGPDGAVYFSTDVDCSVYRIPPK